MFLLNRSLSNSPIACIFLKAKRFSIFALLALTTTILGNPVAVKAQITTDGSTATEVKGNVVSPTGVGTVNGGNLYNSFDRFNVPSSGVTFNTGNSSVDGAKVNNIINRVTGGDPSSILGTIESRQAFPNANLYLLNPNGVVFGNNARLDIGGSFYATTGTGLGFDQNQKFNVDKNSFSFPSGDPKSIQFAIAQPAGIINQGNLTVTSGKNISLTGGTVINTGSLTAPSGNINLAAVSGNTQVELRSPDLVLGFAVVENAIPAIWNGSITTLPKLAELLTGQASQANQVVVKPDGTIALVSSPSPTDTLVTNGAAIASGKIDVSSNISKGGNVGVFGKQVNVVNAQIEASGAIGGGNVLIGGDLQGKGTVPNSVNTFVSSNSVIAADALQNGNGGKIIVWADKSTTSLGSLSATGGKIEGDGGFIEISGKEKLNLGQNWFTNVKVFATNGKAGTLLLDPNDIVIQAGAVGAIGGSPTNSNILGATDINTFLQNTASLIIQTNGVGGTGNITVNAGANISWSSANSLRLIADNDITLNGSINNGGSGNFTAQAGNSIQVNSTIDTNGGTIRLTANDPIAPTNAGSLIVGGNITSRGGGIDLAISGAGRLSINGNLDSGGGNITLRGTNPAGIGSGVEVNANITSGSGIISLEASATNLDGITVASNRRINSTSGSIILTGSSNTANGIRIAPQAEIQSQTGNINLTGFSFGATGGNGVLIDPVTFTASPTTIKTNGNINFRGDTANPANNGVKISAPIGIAVLNIDSGAGNLTVESDRSTFPGIALNGTGTLTLRPFSPNAALQIGGANVFLSSSFLATIVATGTNFSNVFIGNNIRNNNISLASDLFITTPSFAPVTFQTAGTFNANGFRIDTSTANLTLTANQGVSGLGNITASGANLTINSSLGSVSTLSGARLSTSSTDRAGGNITITANGNITTGILDTRSTNNVNSAPGGNVSLTSQTGAISTGDITTTSLNSNGGEVFFNASTQINAGSINTSGATRAGNVTLDPTGDVVVTAIDASSPTQGGAVTLVSTGGNLRITSSIFSSINASCIGASICTSGGTGGSIALQTGGLNPFVVGDASINGSSGILTTGFTSVALGTSIPALLGNIFVQGGISVSPGGFLPLTRATSFFEPPKKSDTLVVIDPINAKLLAIREIFKKEADLYLSEGNLEKAFDLIERTYISELETFTGNSIESSGITLEKTQDLLSSIAIRTGDVAALIYPVLLDNRIEILVIPPKEKGKPFRKFTVEANQEIVEALVTDYRNNLRDVGSNDFLDQSQQLYNWVIRPIEKQLADMKINTLVFVMDSGLRVSPPAALHDGKKFLIENYAIANIASIRVTRVEERDLKSNRILAMGLTESVEGFSALPSVDIEIKTISSEVLNGASFLNKDFTVSNLQNQRQIGTFNILHLGTHAKFISDNSQESFIQFWDSRLKLSQIPRLRFDSPAIDMLTLSACQTAVGNNLGISGLAIESGAKSVLASLWEVSDVGTAPLMISFYKAFPDAIHKAQAMQKAQISLLSGKVNIRNNKIVGIEGFPNIPLPDGYSDIDLSHPFYWSSFILIGNWL